MLRFILIIFLFVSYQALSMEGVWEVYHLDNSSIYSENLRKLAYDQKNDILWIYSNEKMLIYFNGSEWGGVTTAPLEKSSYDKPKSMVVDSHGDLWIAWQNLGLVKFDGEHAYPYDVGTKYFNNLAVDSEDNKWISASKLMKMSTDNSVTIYDEDNSSLPSNRSIKAPVVFDSDSNMYVATDCGGIAKRTCQGSWELYTADEIGASEIRRFNCMYAAAFDSDDFLYIGTQTSGLCILNEDKLVAHYSPDNSILPEHVDQIHIDSKDYVWVPKWGEGICLFDGYDWVLIDQNNSPLPSNNIYSIVNGKDGIVWLATDNGLVSFTHTLVSSKSEKISDNLEIYPNPIGDYFVLRNNSLDIDIIDIYDSSGKLVCHSNINPGINRIQTSDLSMGAYFYRLMYRNKLIKSGILVKQ